MHNSLAQSKKMPFWFPVSSNCFLEESVHWHGQVSCYLCIILRALITLLLFPRASRRPLHPLRQGAFHGLCQRGALGLSTGALQPDEPELRCRLRCQSKSSVLCLKGAICDRILGLILLSERPRPALWCALSFLVSNGLFSCASVAWHHAKPASLTLPPLRLYLLTRSATARRAGERFIPL